MKVRYMRAPSASVPHPLHPLTLCRMHSSHSTVFRLSSWVSLVATVSSTVSWSTLPLTQPLSINNPHPPSCCPFSLARLHSTTLSLVEFNSRPHMQTQKFSCLREQTRIFEKYFFFQNFKLHEIDDFVCLSSSDCIWQIGKLIKILADYDPIKYNVVSFFILSIICDKNYYDLIRKLCLLEEISIFYDNFSDLLQR